MNRNSERARTICFRTHAKEDDAGAWFMVCSCGCGVTFYPALTAWRADHARRWAQGGKDTPENLWPIMEKCDTGKGGKAADDTKWVAKGKRNFKKHNGISASSRPMPGSKRSGFRKRMDGTVERRS